MASERLGGEDLAWLSMEDATNPMVVNALLELAGPLPLHRVHALVERLASTTPAFRARLVPAALHLGRPSWQPAPDFVARDHVEHVQLDSGSEGTLRRFVGGVVSTLLDDRRPLWQIYAIDRPCAGTTLLVRVHHALADGFALLGVLLSLCDDDACGGTPASPVRARRRPRMVISAARALQRLITHPADPRTLLKGPLGPSKRVAWSEPIALDDVKRVARVANGTVNDVLVAAAAGALGRYLTRRGESEHLELHAMVPVNLRAGGGPASLGNRFGLVLLGLPVGIREPLARVTAVKQRMDLLKATPEAPVAYGLLRALGRTPHAVADPVVRFFGRKASLVLTNVPGPRARVKLAGIPVTRVVFWVPQSARMGLGISIFSYAGEVTLGVLSDAGLIPDPEALAADLDAEFVALEVHARTEARRVDGKGGPPKALTPRV